MSNKGYSKCEHCGAEYRLFTICNKNMQGLCKAWKDRHERACAKRTPTKRRSWAAKYKGLDHLDSSIVVDYSHVGFSD